MTEGQTRVIVMILILLGLEILANPGLKGFFSGVYRSIVLNPLQFGGTGVTTAQQTGTK